MITEQGRVIAVECDGLWVETQRSSACGRCAARSGCGQSLLGGAGRDRGVVFVRPSSDHAPDHYIVGSEVDIELPEVALVEGSLRAYGVPLIAGLVLALALGQWGETAAIGGFLAGLASGFLALRFWSPSGSGATAFEPRIAPARKTTEDVIALG